MKIIAIIMIITTMAVSRSSVEDLIIKVHHGDTFGNYNADKPNFVGDTKSIASGEKLEYS